MNTELPDDRPLHEPPRPLPPPTPGSRPARPPRGPGLDRSDVSPKPFVSRALWLAGGSLMLLGAAFWGPFSIVSALAREQWIEEYRQPAADVAALHIDNDRGSVSIVGADTDEIAVSADVQRGLFGVTETAEVVDRVFELRGDCPPIGDEWCRVNYEITVPHDLAVEVAGSSGSTRISGVDGRLTVGSSNGSITLEQVSGRVSVRTSNGSVVARGLSGEVVDASTSNGRIELGFDAPPTAVIARTSNGGIAIGVPDVDGGYHVRTSTSNGSETVDVVSNPASERSIDTQTSNGSIHVFNNE